MYSIQICLKLRLSSSGNSDKLCLYRMLQNSTHLSLNVCKTEALIFPEALRLLLIFLISPMGLGHGFRRHFCFPFLTCTPSNPESQSLSSSPSSLPASHRPVLHLAHCHDFLTGPLFPTIFHSDASPHIAQVTSLKNKSAYIQMTRRHRKNPPHH